MSEQDKMPASGTAYEPLDGAAQRPYDSAAIPSVTAVPMVEVVAPADLQEGYTFEATSDGKTFTVVVPKGGVQKGQSFLAPFPSRPDEAAAVISPTANVPNIPAGHWKDGLCDCLTHGCCHPMFCLALWCEPIALAQVMTRMRLNWCGKKGGVGETSRTFRNVLFVFFGYIILDATLQTLSDSYMPDVDDDAVNLDLASLPTVCLVCYFLDWIVEISFGLYLLYLMIATRQYIRNKYSIPEKRCHGCEDCCCSFWCSFCTLTQMARHTADYDTYRASCCSETGLPAHVPITV